MIKSLLPKILITSCLIAFYHWPSQAQFTEVAGAVGLQVGSGNKDGGVSWGDFNNDGCLDLIVNTKNSTNRTSLFLSDCNLPNPSFTDVTTTHANGLMSQTLERSVVWADFNNDGYLDFARNRHSRFEVYMNKGPGATPAYSFGVGGGQTPDLTVTSVPNGMNVEGFGWMDYNADGWLDLVLENHNYGIDIYENPANGTAAFFHVTPNGSPLGLPTGGTTGDYMSLTDYDNDGNVDIFARKENEDDIWTNTGAGTFVVNPSFNLQARNSNKGSVIFCDFDNDGDFDLYWSDHNGNEIYEQTGLNSGNFTATGEPATSSGVTPSSNIDGCACGDVNNDGHMDLFLAAGSGSSYLYLNNGGWSFTRNNLSINVNGDGEGVAFADYDNDGDIDLYVNRKNANNQLWRNGLNNTDYLMVKILRDLGGGVYRDDVGATAVLKDCSGTVVSGIREVNGTRGHGSQDPSILHFGLPSGNAVQYVVEVGFLRVTGVRAQLDTAVTPGGLPGQMITIITPAGGGTLDGCPAILPVELTDFNVAPENGGVSVNWTTATEKNNEYFTVERSSDGIYFEALAEIQGAGNSHTRNDYTYFDDTPLAGTSYYRLRQTDYEGSETESEIKSITIEGAAGAFNVYPNPLTGSQVQITYSGEAGEELLMVLYDLMGNEIVSKLVVTTEDTYFSALQIHNDLPPGIYFVKGSSSKKDVHYIERLVVR